MKKYVLIIFIFALSACGTQKFEPYVGKEKVIQGSGGYMESNKNGIVYFKAGLPDGYDCKLLGLLTVKDSYSSDTIKATKENGGNTLVRTNSERELSSLVYSGNMAIPAYIETNEFEVYDCQESKKE